MTNENTDKIKQLAKTLDIESEALVIYIEENNLDIDVIISAIKESDFSKEDIKQLFNLEHTSSFNPFIFLITELKGSIKNLSKILNHFEKYNLKREILVTYFGIANLINEDKEMLLPILKEALETYDKVLADYIIQASSGKLDDLAAYSKKLVNIIKFAGNTDIETEYACNIDYNRKLISICYMRIFLDIAKLNYEDQEMLKYSELDLIKDIDYCNHNLFFEDLELYEKVVFDKIVEMILTDFDRYCNEIFELLNYFIYEKDGSLSVSASEIPDNKSSKKPESTKDDKEKTAKENIKLSYINLEKLLKEKIIGQEVVIQDIMQRLKTADFGVSKEVGAKAVFLLVGPTGVGKTEVVKIISKNIGNAKNNQTNLIRIDMSEYKEEHTVSKLLGAPPGYVGYEDKEENTVFDKVKASPNAVILLDEIEKAHPEVLDVFLHIFDEGKAMTNKQKEVDFTNNIIFMTSNIGTSEVNQNSIGFNDNADKSLEARKTYKKALEKYLRPEFINRVDEILIFNALKKAEIMVIINSQIKNIELKLETMKQINIKIEISASALEYLITKMEFNKYGAREVRRTIEKYILNEIINLSINSNIKKGVLSVGYNNDKLDFNYEEVKVLKKTKKGMH